jgi:hypothetical protein
MFQDMLDRIDTHTARALFNLEVVVKDEQEEIERIERLERNAPDDKPQEWLSPAQCQPQMSPAKTFANQRRSSATNRRSNRTTRASAVRARNIKNVTARNLVEK